MPYKFLCAAARITFVFFSFLAAITGGLSAYILAPLYSYYYFNDFNPRKNHRYFLPIAFKNWQLAYHWLSDRSYRDMFILRLSAPPMLSPDPKLVRLTGSWKAESKDCNQCIKCCEKIKCPLLDREKKLCSSYGSFFWRYFNCGRYPETTKQIKYYNCPKWELIPQVAVSGPESVEPQTA